MSNERNIWYRAGHAIERARQHAATPATRAAKPRPEAAEDHALGPLAEKALGLAAVASGGALVTAALRLWPARYRPSVMGLVKAGAAGAGAAVARMALGKLLGEAPGSTESSDPLAPVLSGVARGMIYASVVDPRLPGPVLVRGATFGALEYAAEPWGGLEGLLEHMPPHRRIPFLSSLLDARTDDPSLAGQIFFGMVLASLYGRGTGTR